ncbi:SMI1/KNR4 family protein [Acidovorax sp. GBBC 3334]|uniref:SMI1/KNR4 family protein n=1 Tax=Acidovorax sp. GBBC 3334 TaxID=2940496 RepID=UPI0023038CDB|nr:SMI1/KNR4 family protein [Acidovorax sp. GBBC 3334]MDA8453806.1 SMI1/KNR4 family protein [Acidovorax sp. GBBC 3334]
MLENIENKFNFIYPEVYKKLHDENMLNWGDLGPNWHKEVYPNIRTNPPFLLFSNDFKIIPITDINKETEKIIQRIGSSPKIIPFGKDGVGNIYNLNYAENSGLDSVCILNRDDSLIKLAKNLEDFIFRELLASCTQINPDDIEDEEEFNQDLLAMLESHKPYLTPPRYNLLSSIYKKPITEEDGELGKIAIDEYFKILDQEISFPEINKKIQI